MAGGTTLAVGGALGCGPTAGLTCLAVPAGAGITELSASEFDAGLDKVFGDYTHTEGLGVALSLSGTTHQGDVSPDIELLKGAGIVSLEILAAKLGGKVLDKADDVRTDPGSLTAAERSASFQGEYPYEGIDSLRNIELSEGKRIAHVTFREDGRPISEYFTTESAIRRSTLADGTIDANRLNQGLQIHAGTDPITGLQRPDFKPVVQFFETKETIPMGQVAFGRTLANPVLNPGNYPSLPNCLLTRNIIIFYSH